MIEGQEVAWARRLKMVEAPELVVRLGRPTAVAQNGERQLVEELLEAVALTEEEEEDLEQRVNAMPVLSSMVEQSVPRPLLQVDLECVRQPPIFPYLLRLDPPQGSQASSRYQPDPQAPEWRPATASSSSEPSPR